MLALYCARPRRDLLLQLLSCSPGCLRGVDWRGVGSSRGCIEMEMYMITHS